MNRPAHAFMLVLLLGATACATTIPGRVEKAKTPTEHFQAKAVATDDEIRLAIHAQGLSANQMDALGQFADDWDAAEGGAITVRTPSSGPNSAAAFRTADGTRSFLIRHGVPADQIMMTSDTTKDPAAALVVSYRHYEALVPACGKTWTNIARTAKNEVQPNFGCAVTANFAAQLADPTDLIHPHAMAPSDGARRATVLDKYRKGQVTSSDKDEKSTGAISDAVK